MEFDWMNSPSSLDQVKPKEIEECFEDPFGIRLLPEGYDEPGSEARYFLLARSVSGRALFVVFWTDGKRYRVIQARLMTELEEGFYERKNADVGG